jgi:hypothetical protein
MAPPPVSTFPTPLDAYPPAADTVWRTLGDRLHADPFNGVATAIFLLAILHTFVTARFVAWAHHLQHAHDERLRAAGLPPRPSVRAELLHFLGEVEVVFGLWAVVLVVALVTMRGWEVAKGYVNHTVNYTEPLFVVVIMALASTRPIVSLAEAGLRKIAGLGRGTPAAWWFTILTVGPLLGSFVTEPAAMTICALLLARQFYDLNPSTRFQYATLGLLFVNVSIGGTLTHFAAPPVLMVARPWGWTTPFMMGQFGWRAVVAIVLSNLTYLAVFWRELRELAARPPRGDAELPEQGIDGSFVRQLPVPAWVTLVHVLFMAWTVFTSHYPALFIAGFLFFLGFAKATASYQSRVDLGPPLLVGFFLGGLVIHGGLQGWWIAPVLASLAEVPLFLGAMVLTAFNDNALITYLATLVPGLSDPLKVAVVGGAVVGGGLTVIANAPNPAGQALLSRFFGGTVAPLGLLLGALVPTLIAGLAFRLL